VHYKTEERLPDELFEKIRKARTFQAGRLLLGYLHKCFIDLKLHTDYDTSQPADHLIKEDLELSKRTAIIPRNDWERSLSTFDHAFADPAYASAYWSYLWAEVLSADCFAKFEEAGLENEDAVQKVGSLFRETVLGLGGGVAPAEVFRRFRGRDPNPQALLRHKGLIST